MRKWETLLHTSMEALLLITRYSLRGGVNGKQQHSHRNSSEHSSVITAMHTWMQRSKTLLMYSLDISNHSMGNLHCGSLAQINIVMLGGKDKQSLKKKGGHYLKGAGQMETYFTKVTSQFQPQEQNEITFQSWFSLINLEVIMGTSQSHLIIDQLQKVSHHIAGTLLQCLASILLEMCRESDMLKRII
uniref:Uncharacterized protein n=1 Tax=Opuntia streptacantha TaxID=393608 RepID=A0A7C9EJZ1_OPUST